MGQKEKTLLYGTLDLLILQALSGGSLHGYGVVRWLTEVSGNRIQVTESSLYTALYRLEEKGLLRSEWGPSSPERRARFYSLTHEGKGRLARETRDWTDFTDAVARVLSAKRGPRGAPGQP